ncbi:MAG: hypothetical protein JXX14_21490, partial [Deltaproteobacteria bacterium]|nr:hypothetical protein [Deltaproteobacteria bacterium]
MEQAFGIDIRELTTIMQRNTLGSVWVTRFFQRMVRSANVVEIYEKMNEQEFDQPFPTAILNALNITTDVSNEELKQ